MSIVSQSPRVSVSPTVLRIEHVPLNGQPATLAETIDHEALAYRAWKTPTGDFLATKLEELATLVRWTGAATPADHIDRMDVWDAEIAEQHFDRGYREGFAAAQRQHGLSLNDRF
jgi:hypothetical protein